MVFLYHMLIKYYQNVKKDLCILLNKVKQVKTSKIMKTY